MSIRRITGSIAAAHHVVQTPQSAPWPMCRTCWNEVEKLELVDNPEPRPGVNPLKIRVRAQCHGAEETVAFDMLSEEILAQDPELLAKMAARWKWFDESIGHVGK